MSRVVFDQEAFYPFRRLVEGPLTNVHDLAKIERFLRAAVLHDEIQMDIEPSPGPDDVSQWSEEEIARGVRAVIVSFGPTLEGYESLLPRAPVASRETDHATRLPARLVAIARRWPGRPLL
jgi:hypothetical protein